MSGPSFLCLRGRLSLRGNEHFLVGEAAADPRLEETAL